ncbi:MAG: HAD family hydrolase [Parachlamydiales bacterium]|jgi:hypothetical protein
MPGILACDIDGTLTDSPFEMPSLVAKALRDVYDEGWKVIFITGRPYVWGVKPLSTLDFSYYFAVINGANLLEMPQAVLMEELLIPKDTLGTFDDFCADKGTDYIAYSGYSGQDICYYRPKRFSPNQIKYLKERSAAVGEVWLPVDDFNQVPLKGFASIKCFGNHKECQVLAHYMEKELHLHAPTIRDPFNNSHFVAQATHKECTKGLILKRFAEKIGCNGPIIAAGDDYNDMSMLKVADVRIVMETAPQEILSMADYIAPPASQAGLAAILLSVIKKVSSNEISIRREHG